jgi:hypothetical protein
MIKITHSGNFNNTYRFFNNVSKKSYIQIFRKYGQLGVDALSSATPMDTGKTAMSWIYKISRYKRGITLSWHNTHSEGGAPVAILIQYGHGTRQGGYVQGIDYINPAMRPIFISISENLWREVQEL